jgi:hypothetical protein
MLRVGTALKNDLSGSSVAIRVTARQNLTAGDSEIGQVDQANPNAVVVGLGTDLASSPIWRQLRDRFVPDIERLIAKLSSRQSHPKVFLCLPPPSALPAFDPRGAVLLNEIVPLLKQAARETQCELIDFQSALKDRMDLMNGLEPDDLGAEVLADSVAEMIATGRKSDWRVLHADSEETDEGPAVNAIDGDSDTYWHTNYSTTQERYPHELDIDTGSIRTIGGFSYLPRQDGVNGRVAKYEFYVSLDGKEWGKPVASGVFPQGSDVVKVHFEKPATCRFFRFKALSEQQGQIWASVAELDLLKFYPKRL